MNQETIKYPVPINNNDQYINDVSPFKDTINSWEAIWDNMDIDVHFHIYGVAQSSGHHIFTSRIIKIENNKAYTRNSIYQLGFPKHNYMEKISERQKELEEGK